MHIAPILVVLNALGIELGVVVDGILSLIINDRNSFIDHFLHNLGVVMNLAKSIICLLQLSLKRIKLSELRFNFLFSLQLKLLFIFKFPTRSAPFCPNFKHSCSSSALIDYRQNKNDD